MGEAGKEPLSKGIDRISCESSALIDLAVACGDVKLQNHLPLLSRERPPFCRHSAAWC